MRSTVSLYTMMSYLEKNKNNCRLEILWYLEIVSWATYGSEAGRSAKLNKKAINVKLLNLNIAIYIEHFGT